MQGMPQNHNNTGSRPQFRMTGSKQPSPLTVEQSRLSTQNSGIQQTKNQRVPAVNTLKSGGPRLAPIESSAKSAKKPKKKFHPADIRDFLLGLVVGLLVFGIAAIFVCGAVVDMLTFL